MDPLDHKKMALAADQHFATSNHLFADCNGRPNPNTPSRRGRGKPPKPKDPLKARLVYPTKSRGHLRKDPNGRPASAKVEMSSGIKEPRGRPRKMARSMGGLVLSTTTSETIRPKGRPSKVRLTLIGCFCTNSNLKLVFEPVGTKYETIVVRQSDRIRNIIKPGMKDDVEPAIEDLTLSDTDQEENQENIESLTEENHQLSMQLQAALAILKGRKC
ncbi:hypothetical protein FNV43_RR10988 [Rhamnella rubrinervis]|uniref:Uncharacterized protein n=1 Tax=Rhamnella rubrinervis TaxID=2594499 RepID=A0A8K0H4Y9_9ROSA|nr:hypothetical protein FNV43_RR10988 [Rhamnella rubrinervis]